jgi:hypothetical protein
MRLLTQDELSQVSGAGRSDCNPRPCDPKPCKEKGNNGYGNGGHDGVPGNSGKQDRTR